MNEIPDFATPFPHLEELLREDYLPQYGRGAGGPATAVRLKDRACIERLVRGAQPVTPDTALRLPGVFTTMAEYWMALHVQHDLSIAITASQAELRAIQPP